MADILPRHKRMVLWGFTDNLDSFRHIHRHYEHALKKLGKEIRVSHKSPHFLKKLPRPLPMF